MLGSVIQTGAIIGTSVRDLHGTSIGRVVELAIDPEEGNVRYAVLALRRSLGLGEKFIAVPWRSILWSSKEEQFILDVDIERLNQLPSFERDQWNLLADTAHGSTLHEHFGAPPWWH